MTRTSEGRVVRLPASDEVMSAADVSRADAAPRRPKGSAARGARMHQLIGRLRPSADAGGHARLRLRLVLFGALVILAFAASTAYDAWRSHEHAIASTDGELMNLASALAEQTDWTWQSVDLLLLDISRWRQCMSYDVGCTPRMPRPSDADSSQRLDAFLATVAARAPQVHSIRVVDARGILTNFSSQAVAAQGLDVSGRAYFQALKNGAARGLYVSEPLLSRSDGRTEVILARRLEDPAGRFDGVVGASIDLEELHRLYAAVNLRGNIMVQLLRDDGTLLARSPRAPELIGRHFPLFTTLMPGGATRVTSPFTGEREFVAMARVPSVPLIVAASRSETTALANSDQEAVHGTARTLLLAVLATLTIAALLRQLSRIEQVGEVLRQSQKMEAIGTLAGGIAHDFNNILGAIVGYGELAQQQAPEGSALRRYLDNIMQAAGRARALVDRILGFSRSGLAEQVPIAIQSVIVETLELLKASLPSNIHLERELTAPNAAVLGDETRLHQVMMNLCTNAAQAMPEGGVLRVVLEPIVLEEPRALGRGTLPAGAYVRLTIADSGTGIPPDVLEHIFDPFFTTKPVGGGTGLGLAMVDGIVLDLGGAIEVSSRMGMGTTFQVTLPTTSEPARPLVSKAREAPRGAGQSIMVVDDEPALVSLIEEMLAELGYEPVGFGSSRAALEAFLSEPDRFEAVLTDETMPDLPGTALARCVLKERPHIPIILMSGRAGPPLVERAAAEGLREVLRKPVQRRDLAESLARCLSRR